MAGRQSFPKSPGLETSHRNLGHSLGSPKLSYNCFQKVRTGFANAIHTQGTGLRPSPAAPASAKTRTGRGAPGHLGDPRAEGVTAAEKPDTKHRGTRGTPGHLPRLPSWAHHAPGPRGLRQEPEAMAALTPAAEHGRTPDRRMDGRGGCLLIAGRSPLIAICKEEVAASPSPEPWLRASRPRGSLPCHRVGEGSP